MRQVRWQQSNVSGPLLILRILSVLLLALPLSAFGQDVPYLVRDLPGLTIHDSMPYGQQSFWANTGNITWFTALTASGGREIFKTDGTSAGTVQVTHGVGVPESKYVGPFLGIVNGKLIYGGVDGSGDAYAQALYALDTNGGDPVLLHRIQLAYLTNGIVRDSKLFFSARPDTSTDHELWVTDGTPTATVPIDLLPGDQGAFNGSPDTRLYSAGRWMYFFGTTPQGTGLHRTDGTAENTLFLRPFPKNIYATLYMRVATLADRLIVSFGESATQMELWATDGSTAGTIQIATTRLFLPIGVVGGQLLFDSDGIWTTDGTQAGTHPSEIVKSFSALGGLGNSGGGRVSGNRLFFIRNGWVYVTDGTAAGTHSPFIARGNLSWPVPGFIIGNFYYFGSDDGVHGVELWRTDGTATEMVADINPGPRNSIDNDAGFARPDGTALFAATNYNTGREPWITDGTAAGTHILQNIAADDPLNGSSPEQLRAAGSELFFAAHLTSGPAIGMSDGTSAGTSAAPVDYRWSIGAVGAGNGHYFFGNDVDGFYASDGTSAGTTRIYNFISYGSFEPLPNGLAFLDHSDLWFSDGTIAGTRRLRSFDPTAYLYMFRGSSVAWIAIGTELWKTDGSDAGTVRIPLNPAPTDPIYDVIEAGSRVYFLEESSSTHNSRLWRADTDGANTTMVRELATYRFVGATAHMVYFTGGGGKVYRTDGTESGTIELPAELPSGYDRLCRGGISAAVGDTLFFISSNQNYYVPVLKLWRSDGTVAGTTALQVMSPPPATDDDCRSLVARGDNVYYSGYDADHGWELWQSDGTAAGTQLTADIYPGPQSSSPLELTLAGNRIFFSADSPNIGSELWALAPQVIRHRAVRP